MNKTIASANNNEKGFSLLEMMIAIVLFLIAIAAVYQIMRLGTIQRNTISTRSDANKGARIALNYLRRDVINAGLSYHNVGGYVPDNYANKTITAAFDGDTEQDFLTALTAGDNVKTNILNPSVQTDSIAIVTRDLSFNDGKIINFTGTSASGSTVVVTTPARSDASGADFCKQFDLYLFATATSQVVGIVTSVPDNKTLHLAFGDPLGINLAANGSGNAKSALIGSGISGTLKKIEMTSYHVNANGVLVRTTFGNQTGLPAAQQIKTSELIPDVKDFQITYLMNDGTTTSDPSLGNNGRDNQQNMNDVIEIKATLNVMQQQESAYQVSSSTIVKEVISTRNLRYSFN